MSATAITQFGPVEGGLSVVADPQRMLDQARKAADVLMRLVEEKKLYLEVGKRKHLMVEAWETLAHFYGITAKVVDVHAVVDELTGAAGFEATAEAIHMATGTAISAARSLCLNNEDNWSVRPKYQWENGQKKQIGEVAVPTFQLASMAQTRAVGKVLRNVLAFVVVLAGYESTPAEEMTGTEPGSEKPKGQDPQPKNGGAEAAQPKRISEPQRKRLFAIAKEHQVPMQEVVKVFQGFGFKQAFEIDTKNYDAIITKIQQWSPSEAA